MNKLIVILSLILFTIGGSAPVQPELKINTTFLSQKLAELKQDTSLRHASLGFCLMDIDNGGVLLQSDAERSLVPASTLKILTTSAALSILGPDFRFETKLAYTGKVDVDGTLHGNILIIGGGDPTLGSDRIEGNPGMDALLKSWVNAIQAKGIKNIDGKVLSIDNRYAPATIPPDWLWEDIGNYYGAGSFSLNINENLYSLFIGPGSSIGAKPTVKRTEPDIPGLSFHNELVTTGSGKADSVYIFGAPHCYDQYLRGTVPLGKNEIKVKGSIPDPSYFAALMLEKALKSAQIIVSATASCSCMDSTCMISSLHIADSISIIASFYSPPLSDILHITNLKSINLYAETLLKEIGLHQKGEGSTRMGLEVLKEYWKQKGLPLDGLFMVDGSGLSPTNSITATQLAKALSLIKNESWFDAFYNSLPVAGKTGSMRNIGKGKDIEGKLRAKTGHMSRVRSYAGYIQAKNGHWLSFALIINNYEADNFSIYKKVDKLMQALAL